MLAISPFDALGVPFQYCLEFFTNIFKVIGPLNAIGAFGLAIVVTTIIIRGALFPIFGWQLRCRPALVQRRVLVGMHRGITNATSNLTSVSHPFLRTTDVSKSGAQACCPA